MAAGKPKLGLKILLGPPPGSSRGGSPMGRESASPSEENAFDRPDSEPDELLVGAASDVMDALRSRDAASFAASLRDFVSMC